MSHSASISLYIPSLNKLSVPEIIRMYLANGWNLDDYGHISMRPLGDRDDFNWVNLELSQVDELFIIINNKVEAGEDPGITLMIDKTEIGACVIFFLEKKEIFFHLLINRKRHPEISSWTDVSWYLPFILKPLNKNGIDADEISYSESL